MQTMVHLKRAVFETPWYTKQNPGAWAGVRWWLRCLEQNEVVGQVDPQLVLIVGAGTIGAQGGVAYGNAHVLEEAALHLVIQAQVTLPLPVARVCSDSIEVAAAQVLGSEAQARHVISKVVVVLTDPGFLA